jgi:hypothetical protein
MDARPAQWAMTRAPAALAAVLVGAALALLQSSCRSWRDPEAQLAIGRFDTTEVEQPLTSFRGTLPIDSVRDLRALHFDIWKIESEDYPREIRLMAIRAGTSSHIWRLPLYRRKSGGCGCKKRSDGALSQSVTLPSASSARAIQHAATRLCSRSTIAARCVVCSMRWKTARARSSA